jgi:hypothetical protein
MYRVEPWGIVYRRKEIYRCRVSGGGIAWSHTTCAETESSGAQSTGTLFEKGLARDYVCVCGLCVCNPVIVCHTNDSVCAMCG